MALGVKVTTAAFRSSKELRKRAFEQELLYKCQVIAGLCSEKQSWTFLSGDKQPSKIGTFQRLVTKTGLANTCSCALSACNSNPPRCFPNHHCASLERPLTCGYELVGAIATNLFYAACSNDDDIGALLAEVAGVHTVPKLLCGVRGAYAPPVALMSTNCPTSLLNRHLIFDTSQIVRPLHLPDEQ